MSNLWQKLHTILPKKPTSAEKREAITSQVPLDSRIQLGDLVRDAITGFEGIANARMEFLNLCVRWQVQPQALHEMKPVEAHVFDEEQLILVKAAVATTTKLKQTGGDHKMPGRKVFPSRY